MSFYEKLSVSISFFAFFLSLASTIFVFLQIKLRKKQIFLDNFSRISTINRELLTLGFNDGELFDILDGKKIENTSKQKRYIQLWVNQADIIFAAYNNGTLDKKIFKGFRGDIGELFSNETFRRHWSNVKHYYSNEMQEFIQSLINTHHITHSPPNAKNQH